ncbi:Copia protein [Porphyridium purpureum]|uniref:Copia protein n=1 Tax=Porphyridium purpureum TaxID=35688 RepID=A0A5J4YGE4_PORPP|nr:Copia protein [Porphyridium purpureum]|eukprot:POR9130..scf271_22
MMTRSKRKQARTATPSTPHVGSVPDSAFATPAVAGTPGTAADPSVAESPSAVPLERISSDVESPSVATLRVRADEAPPAVESSPSTSLPRNAGNPPRFVGATPGSPTRYRDDWLSPGTAPATYRHDPSRSIAPAPSWWPATIQLSTQVIQALELAEAGPTDNIERMMVDGIVTCDWLMEADGPAAVYAWQDMCRRRRLPFFEDGTNVRSSFEAYARHANYAVGSAQCFQGMPVSGPTASAPLPQPSQVSSSTPSPSLPVSSQNSNPHTNNNTIHLPSSLPNFIKYLSEDRFTGEEGGIAFARWKRRVILAQRTFALSDELVARALPLIVGGRAESILFRSAETHPRLAQMLSLLGSTFASEAALQAHRIGLKQLDFHRFVKDSGSLVAAFDALNRTAEEHCAALGDGRDDPNSVSEFVMDAMFHSRFAPSLVSFQDRKGHSVVQSVRAFLANLDRTDGLLIPSFSARNTYFSGDQRDENDESTYYTRRLVRNDPNRHVPRGASNPGGSAVPKQKVVCDFCGKNGHMRATCWKLHPEMVAIVGDVEAGSQDDRDSNSGVDTVVGLCLDVYSISAVLPAVLDWSVFVDSGAGRSVAGLNAYKRYCAALGRPAKLKPAHGEAAVRWGRLLEPLGIGVVRLPVGEDHFVEFRPVVVDSDDLPILFGGKDQDKFGFNLIRTSEPPCLSSRAFKVPLFRLPSGHLVIHFDSPNGKPRTLDTILYTVDELMVLHKKFGHASGRQIRKLLDLSKEAVEPRVMQEFLAKVKECAVCQWYTGRRSTYKVAAEINADFNHVVFMDFVFLHVNGTRHKVLHAVCGGTKWNAAGVVKDGSASGVFNVFFRIWIQFFGAPHRLRVDREKVLEARDFKLLLENEGCVLDPVVIEGHWQVGVVERHHESLRKLCTRVSLDSPSLKIADILAVCCRAINNTVGPENIIPSLLVFGTVPRLSLHARVAQHDSGETQVERISAMQLAREEWAAIASHIKLKAAQNSRVPEFPNEENELRPGIAVLVRRERSSEWTGGWTGPYVVVWVDKERAAVGVVQPSSVSSDRARTLTFSIHNIKVYHPPNALAPLSTIFAITEEQESSAWEEADMNEILGVLQRQTLQPVSFESIPRGANILGARMERVTKANGTSKSRLVVQGFRDPGAKSVNVDAPVLTKFSFRFLVSVAVLRGSSLFYRDYSQAYLQSEEPLAREVYLRLKPDVQRIFAKITSSSFPAYAKLIKPLYGLTESGAYWHSTIRHAYEEQGFCAGALDPCVMYLTSRNKTHGAVGILVDDTICVGDEYCLAAERNVASRYENKGVMSPPFVFNGFEVESVGSGASLSHAKYVKARLGSVSVNGFEDFRKLRGQLAYLANGTRPDLLCAVALASQVTEESYTELHGKRLVRLCSRIVKNPARLIFGQLGYQDLCLRVYADASYASNSDCTSQIGFVVFLGDKSDNVHLLHAQSNKSRQVAHSVLGAELLALCIAFDFAEAVQTEYMNCGVDVPIVLATDSRQVFDAITRSSTLAEKRQLVRMLVLRQGLQDMRISRVLHVPGRLNVADALTKERECTLWEHVLQEGTLPWDFSASVYLVE